MASLSVQEAESLKTRITGLEERMSQASPTTPLILPPTPRLAGIGSEMSRAETLTEREAQEGSTEEESSGTPPGDAAVGGDLPNGLSIQTPPVGGTETSKEQEITTLKDTVKKLQEELSQTRQQCTTLQEREQALQQALDGQTVTTGERTDDSIQNRTEGVTSPILNVSQCSSDCISVFMPESLILMN